MNITLSDEQSEGLSVISKKINQIRNNEIADKFASLSGFAGTGKTTIMSFFSDIIHDEGMSIANVCFTGKASSVLRKKLTSTDTLGEEDSCSTIHSLIYKPIMKNGKVIGWTRKDELEVDMIVIDEASMVSKILGSDLMSYNLPILAVGDAGQLPAIGESISLVNNADYSLETIHRQALDSPIIKMSMIARTEDCIPRGIYGHGVMKLSYLFDNKSKNIIKSFCENFANRTDSIILCGMHKTRVKLNSLVRSLNGFNTKTPCIGEKLICLKNQNDAGVFNGNHGTLVDIIREDENFMHVHIKIEDDFIHECTVSKKLFGITKYNDVEDYIESDGFKKELDVFNGPSIALFDFGYAISFWKSQGSEWPNVLLIEEYNQYQSDLAKQQTRYTGITRAIDKLVVIEDYN